jgi:hypothetical protein
MSRTVVAAIIALGSIGSAVAQTAKDGQMNDGTFPPGFDCNSLSAPRTKLECQTFQQNRTPDNDAAPPGTPAISMPGAPNQAPDNATPGSNPRPQNSTHGKSNAHNG